MDCDYESLSASVMDSKNFGFVTFFFLYGFFFLNTSDADYGLQHRRACVVRVGCQKASAVGESASVCPLIFFF